LRIQEQNGVCPCPTQSLAHIWSDANGGGGGTGRPRPRRRVLRKALIGRVLGQQAHVLGKSDRLSDADIAGGVSNRAGG
jgi:hypothetical protein